MLNIENEDFSNKVVLEVGNGRGDTTRKLVYLLAETPGAQLIVTDISDKFFQQLHTEFQSKNIQIKFIRSGACELQGIPDGSIDFLICNYTLCAVNSQAGLANLALKRFWEVLKSGGKLFIEEEFPISKQTTPLQEIWAEKWRILKSALILAGQFSYNEIAPEVLTDLCHLIGFEKVEWTEEAEIYHEVEVLDFFQKRLKVLLKEIPDENLRAGFTEMAVNLRNKAVQVGGMEIPYYRFVAQKGNAEPR
ncbi:MAG TPA: class I SAM-dependent methyltransferase [Anaerolineales bacterium]|nr:class I SAM-dependent methyltransferase [Anaerolineales bacterium]